MSKTINQCLQSGLVHFTIQTTASTDQTITGQMEIFTSWSLIIQHINMMIGLMELVIFVNGDYFSGPVLCVTVNDVLQITSNQLVDQTCKAMC